MDSSAKEFVLQITIIKRFKEFAESRFDTLPFYKGESVNFLFSGEDSLISIRALQDLEVMVLSAAIVNQMIDRQPSFAREISQILEIRRTAVRSTLQITTKP